MRTAFALTAVALVALGFALRQPDPTPAKANAPAPIAAASTAAAPAPDALDPAQADRARQVRWRLTYQHQVSMAGEAIDPTVVSGEWRAIALGPDRRRVEFVPEQIGGLEDLPTTAEAHRAFDQGLVDGRLDSIGFAPGTTPSAAGLLTTLACAFAYTPGPGAAWRVEEEDRLGWFTAEYRREDDRVIRHRRTYLRLRNGALGRPEALVPSGDVVYVFDAEGLARVDLDQRITWSMHPELPTVEVRVQGTLERLDARPVPTPTDLFALAEIRPEDAVDPADGQSKADAALLEDTTRAAILARITDPALLGNGADARQARVRSFARLSALVRLQPDAIADVSQALREAPVDTVGTLAGALAEAGDPRAVDALAGLLGEPLPLTHRSAAARALATARPVTPAAREALTEALQTPELRSAATLATGAAARALEEAGDTDAAFDLIDQLLAAYAQATSLSARLNLLSALGNTASARVMPTLRAAYADPDPRVRGAALYAMRAQPDAEVDALLQRELLQGLQMIAARTIAYRSPALWLERLEVAVDQVAPAVRPVVAKTLRVWRTQAALAQR